MTKDNDGQVRAETFGNAMFKRYRVHVTIPGSGRIDLNALSATLAKLSAGEVKTLEDVRLWANNAETPAHQGTEPTVFCDPLSEEGFRLEVAGRLKAVERLREQVMDEGGADATVDALIRQTIALGRVIERANMQQKFLSHVEVGKKVEEGGRSGGNMRRGQLAPDTQDRLDRMASFVNAGATYAEAARMLFAETNEWTIESNYKLLKRNRK